MKTTSPAIAPLASWSVTAFVTLLLTPSLAYLLGAGITHDLNASGNAPHDAMFFGLALGALMLRVGAMIFFAFSAYRLIFTRPGSNTPGWMVKRQKH
ncbi:hypothetical protein JY96_21295 [Aquabacterium sp. NJ1]|uniref:hypothetical protein n=1 Tax=Aquabacterium sp. NJ1 TaxID=1538295 RepID=UPI00052D994E|nr:hypothetical protein [Aquabacterium sp. NJ1]KGM38711.1 hypothetical protein JY96_21295 [Aquabacterium sp. NJ1]